MWEMNLNCFKTKLHELREGALTEVGLVDVSADVQKAQKFLESGPCFSVPVHANC